MDSGRTVLHEVNIRRLPVLQLMVISYESSPQFANIYFLDHASMNDSDRFALLFGPYHAPQFCFGDVVTDECRGDVTIVGLTNAAIPWPIGKQGRVKTLVLFGSLIDAVRVESNQAVAKNWGVSGQTVTKWRKALDVGRDNSGSMKLRVLSGYDRAIDALPQARAKLYTPEMRAKQSVAKRGVNRPKHVIKALQNANLGRKPTAEARERMSQAQRARGARPPKAGPAWSEFEDNLCRTSPPAIVASKTGRTLSAVDMRRAKLGITKKVSERKP